MGKETKREYRFFNGKKYLFNNHLHYWMSTGSVPTYLHRDVWEFFNGSIPKGFHIHHKDGDKENNDISNLEMLSSKQHHRVHVIESGRIDCSDMTDDEKYQHHLENCRRYHKSHKDILCEKSKEYREKNKDKIKSITKAYRDAHKRERYEYNKRYVEAHREHVKAYMKKYYEEHKCSKNCVGY